MFAKQVVISASIELALILITTLLLTGPKFAFVRMNERAQRTAYYVGVLFLSVTFAWSVIFGIVLTLNGDLLGAFSAGP